MSRENVDAFKRAIAAYNRRDVEAFLEEFDAEVEWQPLTQVTFGGEQTVYRGHEGIRRFNRELDQTLTEIRVEGTEFRDLGERIVVLGRLRGRGRASGAEAETRIAWLVEFRDGRVVRMRDYLDPEDALQAAGLEK